MRALFLAGLLLTSSAFAECTYTAENAKVTWKAFKTYEKIGVGGTFDRSVFTPKSAKNIDDLLKGSTISIETASINSGNSGRDATLLSSFFNIQKATAISGKIVSVKDSKAQVELIINGITKIIPMAYSLNNDKIIGKGVIDLGDFNMIPSLVSINKSCFDLHGGKTWQDIEIGFEVAVKNECK